MKEAKFANLGENHKRSIGTVAVLLDRMLCGFEAYARGRELHGLLYHERNRLSPEQRQEILDEVDRMRGVLKELQETFGLESEVEDVSRVMWGRSMAFWEDLVETETRYLCRYGATPPGLEDYLDPRIERLIERMEAISRVVGSKASGQGLGTEEPQGKP
jgi:hypothetical protein